MCGVCVCVCGFGPIDWLYAPVYLCTASTIHTLIFSPLMLMTFIIPERTFCYYCQHDSRHLRVLFYLAFQKQKKTKKHSVIISSVSQRSSTIICQKHFGGFSRLPRVVYKWATVAEDVCTAVARIRLRICMRSPALCICWYRRALDKSKYYTFKQSDPYKQRRLLYDLTTSDSRTRQFLQFRIHSGAVIAFSGSHIVPKINLMLYWAFPAAFFMLILNRCYG